MPCTASSQLKMLPPSFFSTISWDTFAFFVTCSDIWRDDGAAQAGLRRDRPGQHRRVEAQGGRAARVSAGSAAAHRFAGRAARQAPSCEHLTHGWTRGRVRAAGGVVIGRTNTPAFSLRWFARNSLHGTTLNPHDRTLTPGGSSGGAGSAVLVKTTAACGLEGRMEARPRPIAIQYVNVWLSQLHTA